MPFAARSLHHFSQRLSALLCTLIVSAVALSGCSVSSTLQAITVSPAPGVETLNGAGQTFQYKATGVFQQGKHPPTSEDLTSSVTWTSSNTAVATVSSTGVVTSVGAGTATITASSTTSSGGVISGSSNVAVNGAVGNGTSPVLQSISLIGDASVGGVGNTAQYIAIGNFTNGAPATQDVTNLVTWTTSDTSIARVDATGLVTALNAGSTLLTALYTPAASTANPKPATIIGTTTFSCCRTPTSSTVPTLAVYKVGLNALLGTVNASYTLPAGTIPVSLTCGPGATVAQCTMNLPGNMTSALVVTVTTPNKTANPTFGGWSSDCKQSSPLVTAPPDPFTCYVTLYPGPLTNVSVGAIFP